MYSLMESSQDTDQFLTTIHRYVQIGIYVKGYFSKKLNRFQREIIEVCEFFVDEDNKPITHILYQKTFGKKPVQNMPSENLLNYLENQNIDISNLLTNSDSMKNMDDELNKLDSINSIPYKENNFNTNTVQMQKDDLSLPKIPFPNEVL